jgi:hypothetical protein
MVTFPFAKTFVRELLPIIVMVKTIITMNSTLIKKEQRSI